MTTERVDVSLVERHANGNEAITIIGEEATDYSVRDRHGILRWSRSVPHGQSAQRSRQAAARDQKDLLERL